MGYLQTGMAGPILGATFDCFAHHTQGALDLSRGVAFVKLDVEGFEIAVLRGAKHSLFRPGSRVVRAMVAEVGPNRWGRAGVDLAAGAGEMAELATHFRKSFVLLRGDKNCPHSLADGLADHTMDRGASWKKTFTVKLNPMNANIIVQTDGGKRGNESAAASVVIGLFTMHEGAVLYEPWHAEGTLLPGSISVFESKAIAVESGARWVAQALGAAVRDLT